MDMFDFRCEKCDINFESKLKLGSYFIDCPKCETPCHELNGHKGRMNLAFIMAQESWSRHV